MVRLRKKTEIPITTIRLSREQRQLLRLAAAYFNLPYQVYLKRVGIAHAERVIQHKMADKSELKPLQTRISQIVDE